MKTNRHWSMFLAFLAGAWLFGSQATAGTLLGYRAAAPAAVNLTAQGTLDWAQWGFTTNNPSYFNHKSGGASQISDYTEIGTDAVYQFGNAVIAFSWSDGTLTATATDTTTGIYVGSLDTGFQFTVPADTTTKLLKVYAGCWNAQVHVEATLSDGSAPGYVDEGLDDFGVGSAAEYTIKFAANSPGQALTIQVFSSVLNVSYGNCTLMAASLGNAPPGPTVMGTSTQVQNVAVTMGSEASFSFAVTNNANPPVTSLYQWFKNNQLMTNATGSQFTFLAGPGDTNAQVCCVATLPAAFNPNNLPPLTSATGTVTVVPGLFYTNGLKVEFFAGATRQDVEAGNVGPATSLSLVSSFELPVNDGINNYSRRVSGYFIPPTTGNYTFFLCSDDDSDLFLSTDGDPASKQLIAQETLWSNSRQWVDSAGGSSVSQKVSDTFSPDGGLTFPYSGGIPLQQGHLYYLEGVQHQGVGGDNFAVTYKLSGDPDPLDDDPPMLQAPNHNIALVTRPTTSLVWVTQPVSATNIEYQTVTFTASATSDSEFDMLYQWYETNSPVAGATAGSYSFPANLADDNTQWFVTARTAEGGFSTNSAVVTLTVKRAAFPQGLITFEDQDIAGLDTDYAMSPNPYTDLQGLPIGVTATFTNFNSWNADPQHTLGGVWLLYGSALGPNSAVLFNMPVSVPSIWVTSGPYGNHAAPWGSLTAYLSGAALFSYTLSDVETLHEVTNGANVLIDSIIFSNYGGSEIDDITIVKPAKLITFSDQMVNDEPANPNPYTSAQGLWPGLMATFHDFNAYNGDPDHTPDNTDNYLLYSTSDTPSITFNAPVEVPSLWVTQGPYGATPPSTVAGYLTNVMKWTYTYTGGGFAEVTAGAGVPIDSIRFGNFNTSEIDDVTIQAAANPPVPPAHLSLTRNGAGAPVLSWNGQGTLYESSSLTGGWLPSANQANPQTLTVGSGNKFYRIIYP
jgi:hypothetical protein